MIVKYNAEEVRIPIKRQLAGICADYTIVKPSEDMINRITDWIIRSYPTIDPNEIALAFDMNAKGYEWQKVQSFKALDKEFFGSVMAEYLKWKRQQNQRKPSQPELIPISDAESRQRQFNRMMEQRELYGDNYIKLHWPFIYEFALKCGMYHNREEVKAVMARIKKEQPNLTHDNRNREAMKFLFNKYYNEHKNER